MHDFTIHFVDFRFAFIIFFGTSRTLYDIPKTAANETEVMGSNPRSMPFVFKPLHASNTGNLPQLRSSFSLDKVNLGLSMRLRKKVIIQQSNRVKAKITNSRGISLCHLACTSRKFLETHGFIESNPL